MTVVLALIASALFGTGVALQQRPAAAVPREYAARPGLLLRVVRNPVWVVGVVAEIAAFVTQLIALRRGSLLVVQPLLTTSLLFTFALGSWWARQPTSARDWLSVGCVAAGLAAFLAVASPSEDSEGAAPAGEWVLWGASIAAALALLIWIGLRSEGRHRAASLGLAAGLGDAFMAVLTKAFAHATNQGIGSAFTTWIPYALCVAGIGAMLLTQTAYQTGQPKIAIPLITVTEPLVSCGIGVGLFGEAIHVGGLRAPVVVASVAVMVSGLVSLSRSSVVEPSESVVTH
ncbi:MAG TPA: DMT family transporter [Acidimicrobiales bacterium]|nr:DMT family transporter [Acidimicrobiales bacterium]